MAEAAGIVLPSRKEKQARVDLFFLASFLFRLPNSGEW